ncbi:hypothetical protein CBL_10342 [Carabus blaptoides fortunei]
MWKRRQTVRSKTDIGRTLSRQPCCRNVGRAEWSVETKGEWKQTARVELDGSETGQNTQKSLQQRRYFGNESLASESSGTILHLSRNPETIKFVSDAKRDLRIFASGNILKYFQNNFGAADNGNVMSDNALRYSELTDFTVLMLPAEKQTACVQSSHLELDMEGLADSTVIHVFIATTHIHMGKAQTETETQAKVENVSTGRGERSSRSAVRFFHRDTLKDK